MTDLTFYLALVIRILSVLGLVGIIVGGVSLSRNNKRVKSCTKRTTGTVIDVQRDKDVRNGKNVRGTSRFSPVFEYTVEGVTRKAIAAYSARNKTDIKKGDTVDLLYDPKNPEHFITAGSAKSNTLNYVLIIAGVAFIVIGVIVSLAFKLNAYLVF